VSDINAQIYLIEYQKLKDEQSKRIGFRDNLIYVMLAAFGAIFSYVSNQPSKDALLVVPIINFIIGWTYINNDLKVSQISNYVKDILAIKLGSSTKPSSDDVFLWETYLKKQSHRSFRKFIQKFVDLFTFVGTGLLSIVNYYLSNMNGISTNFITFMVLDLFLLLIIAVTYLQLSKI